MCKKFQKIEKILREFITRIEVWKNKIVEKRPNAVLHEK